MSDAQGTYCEECGDEWAYRVVSARCFECWTDESWWALADALCRKPVLSPNEQRILDGLVDLMFTPEPA